MKSCVPMFSPVDCDLLAWTWSFKGGYARAGCGPRASHKAVLAHRMVLERIIRRPLAAGEYCDHLNRNRLDNRRENLQLVTWQQNCQNRGGKPDSSSGGLRGVRRQWLRSGNASRWQATVTHNGRAISCGTFDTREEAAAASAAKRRELGFHGEPSAASFLRDERGAESVEQAIIVGVVVTGLLAVVVAIGAMVARLINGLHDEVTGGGR